MKYCPFCRNEIDTEATQCPHCKRTLVEKFPSAKPPSEQPNTQPPPKETTTKTSYTQYAAAPKTPTPKKSFQFPKGSGWMITIVGSIILTAILNSGNPSSNSIPTNPLPAPAPTEATTANSIPISSPSYNSLPNGTVLFSLPSSLNGSNILSVSNGNDTDAVVKLITSAGVKVYSVYISANGNYSIKNISDGIYRVLFETGSNWDANTDAFLINPSAEEFDSNFDFNKYGEYDISLNPISGGTAVTPSINPSEFNQY